MKYLFLCYPKCTTCAKARKWLDENNVWYEERNIKENNPIEDEIREWVEKSNYPVKKFFNTSGQLYKNLGLKDKLESMSDEEKIKLLASDGMLVKRPLLIGEDIILVGFKEDEWEKIL
ncbi:MAG TPA: arsenate reductase family protein [Tissierellaceae bacterium]